MAYIEPGKRKVGAHPVRAKARTRKSAQRPTEVPLEEPGSDIPLSPLADTFELEQASEPPAETLPPVAAPALPVKPGKRANGAQNVTPEGPSLRAKTIRSLWNKILDDPLYHETVVSRARTGRLPPQLETKMWEMVEGKPPEQKDAKPKPPASLRIVHQYSDGTSETVEG